MAMSALTMEGARGRLEAAGAIASGWLSLLLLENMMTRLDEVVRVPDAVVVPDFIMDMRAGAAPRRADPAQTGALADLRADPHAHRREMGIARVNAVAMVDFHHVA